MFDGFQVTAIIAAYNEGDILGQVLEHLIEQGVTVYLIDHGSTDDTVARARPFLDRGLLAIESFPGVGSISPKEAAERPWRSILRRKEQLAQTLEADWFLHHDADEIRESPWAQLSLSQALRRVDEQGYNAVDFEVFNFHPTDNGFEQGRDLLEAFPRYDRTAVYDRVQIKAWKKTEGSFDLVSSGGHEVVFAGRRVYPVRFILRHYPFRGQAQGQRKVFEDRQHFVAAEREREGWHRQYDEIEPDHEFVRDTTDLIPYNAEAVRLELILRPRGMDPSIAGEDFVSCRRTLDLVSRELDQRNREIEQLHKDLDRRNKEAKTLHKNLDQRNREVEQLHQNLDRRNKEAADREREAGELRRQLEEILASRSWRWTKPLRIWLDRTWRHRGESK